LVALALVLNTATRGAATIPTPVADIVRQLQEWRNLTTGLMQECVHTYGTNETALNDLKISYIEASAIANSLIDQFQLETAAKVPMSPKRYAPHIERAKTASERLIAEAKRLLTEERKTRGGATASTASSSTTTSGSGASSSTTTASKAPVSTSTSLDPIETTRQSVSLLSGVMDIVGKNKKAFADMASEQRKEVSKVLADQKWLPLEQALGRSKVPSPAQSAPANSETKARK
jgi:hypothetical protein